MVASATTASADFCQPFLAPHGARSTRPVDRSPRVRHATFTLMPAAFTSVLSVQASGFEDIGRLNKYDRLVCDFCSSSQCSACGLPLPLVALAQWVSLSPLCAGSFSQHLTMVNLGVFATCRPASSSPCRACRGLAPPSLPTCHHNKSNSACHGTACHAWHTKKKASQVKHL